MRRLTTLLKSVIYITLIITALLCFMLLTNWGAISTIKIISNLVPGHLQVNRVMGVLGSELRLENVFYAHTNFNIAIEKLYIHWHPSQLINKKFMFDDIKTKGVKINIIQSIHKKNNANSSNLSKQFAMLDHIRIDKLAVNDLNIFRNNQLFYQLNEFKLHKSLDHYLFNLISSNGNMNGEFSLATLPHITWDITLHGDNINFNKISNKMNGYLNFNFNSNGEWKSQNKKIHLVLNNIQGKLENFPLQGFVSLDFENGRLQIHDSYLALDNSIAKMAGVLDQNWEMNWQLDIPQLEKILPNTHGSFSSTGSIEGLEKKPIIQAKIAANDIKLKNLSIKKVTGNITSTQKALETQAALTISHININDSRIPEINLNILSQLVDKTLHSNIELALNPTNKMQCDLTLPRFHLTDFSQPIAGHVAINFTELKNIISIPETSELRGRLEGSINIAGNLSNPIVSGEAFLREVHIFINKLGIAIEQLNLTSSYKENQPIHIFGDFKSGNGQGRIDSQISLDKPGYPFVCKLYGNNLQLANLNEYKVNVSPNLNIFHTDKNTNIKGEILIPDAKIKTKDFSNVTKLPNEVVIVDKKSEAPSTNLVNDLILNVKIRLGENISLDYENLHTKLSGELTITQQAGSLAVGTGELKAVNGHYNAYGKLLTINEGRLIYTGNILTDPGLDIRATQTFKTLAYDTGKSMFNEEANVSVFTGSSQTITVGVWVQGTLSKPKITLYSDPAGLNQNDILSYLVFGYPQSQIKGENKLLLLNNLASGFYQDKTNIGGVKQKIQDLFGLTELSVGSVEYFDPNAESATSTTAIRMSKQISNNLSVYYSVGIFNPVSILNLRYQINKYFAIQSQTSNVDSGADLLWNLETD